MSRLDPSLPVILPRSESRRSEAVRPLARQALRAVGHSGHGRCWRSLQFLVPSPRSLHYPDEYYRAYGIAPDPKLPIGESPHVVGRE